MKTWKRFMTAALTAAMTAASVTVPAYADTVPAGTITVEGDTQVYTSLAEAIGAHAEETDPVTMTIDGTVVWETGANHGSTPFKMKTSELTLVGTEGATFTATGAGVGPVGIGATLKEELSEYTGTVVFENLTFVDESVSYAEGSWEFGYLEFRGNLEFVGCEFQNAIQIGQDNGFNEDFTADFVDCVFNSNKSSEYDVWVGAGNASFDNCTFEGYRGLKVHEAYGSDVRSVTVTNCTFDSLSEKPAIAIGTLDETTEINVTGCTVIDCQPGDQGKFIYESDTPVDKFVNNFSEDIFQPVFTAASLKASPSNAVMEEGETKAVEADVVLSVEGAVASSPIEWTSSNEDVVTVMADDETGETATIEAVNVGAAVITASYTAGEKKVQDTISVVVGGDFKVTASSEALKLGQSVKFTANAVASSSNATYDWSVQGGLEVDADEGKTMTAKATAVGGGTATVEFNEGEVNGTGSAAVVIAAPELTVNAPETVTRGKEFRISARVTNIRGEAEDLGIGINIDADGLTELEDGRYKATVAGTETIIVTMTYPTADGSQDEVVVEKEIKVTRPASQSGGGSSDDNYTAASDEEPGKWVQNEKGWWYSYDNGTWPASQWAELKWRGVKNWYYFDAEGYMVTGWHQDGGNMYYLHPTADGTRGYMYTGWKQIDNNWYYFNPMAGGPMGALLVNTTTPDGYQVDANGAWIQ